jgi:HEPN domain-containing protein
MQDDIRDAGKHNRSFRLTEEERLNPYLVIRDTFSGNNIHGIRKMLWAWLKTSLAEKHSGQPKKESLNLIDVYERLEKLIEAAYIINEERRLKGFTAEADPVPGQYGQQIHGNKPADASLQATISFLISAVNPEKIFLLNKNAVYAKDPAGADLLIVIPDSSQKAFKEYAVIVEMAAITQRQPRFSLHKSCDIQRFLTEGHIFYSGVCIKENLVYDNGKSRLPVLPASKATAIKEKAEKDFWPVFNKAIAFLEGARLYYDKKEDQMAAFMLHQAIELGFRAIVLTFSGQDLRTHCIRSLKKQCQRYAPRLSALFPADTEAEETLLRHLENAYIDTRYKDYYEISEFELSTLFEKAALLHIEARRFFTTCLSLSNTG